MNILIPAQQIISLLCQTFMGKVLTLTYLPLEPGCEDFSFVDQAVEDFEDDWILFS